jgi:hypothetical protein
MFWRDSWQKFPSLKSKDHLHPYKYHIQDLEHLKVVGVWLEVSLHPPWRSWKMFPQDLHVSTDCYLQIWRDMVNQRKIHISEDPNILHSGYTPNGTFTIKEGYHLHEKFHNLLKEHLWNIIWKSKLWLKVSTFLWLLVQNKILTWDNLKKRCFMGPSIYHICQQQEETMEHILNQFPISGLIWDHVSQSMRKNNRERNNIIKTIKNWENGPYKSSILKNVCLLLPGFIV